MSAPELLVTERLEGRRVAPDDESFVRDVFADERVTATLGGPRDAVRVHHDLDRWCAHWREHGFGMWILRDRSSDGAVGWTMLHVTETGGAGNVEVGWTIVADRWRDGFAAEAGAAATAVGFATLGLPEIVSFTQPHNVGSRRVMEKIGFRYDGEVEHAGLPHVLYRLDRATWEKTNG